MHWISASKEIEKLKNIFCFSIEYLVDGSAFNRGGGKVGNQHVSFRYVEFELSVRLPSVPVK